MQVNFQDGRSETLKQAICSERKFCKHRGHAPSSYTQILLLEKGNTRGMYPSPMFFLCFHTKAVLWS